MKAQHALVALSWLVTEASIAGVALLALWLTRFLSNHVILL